MLLSAYLNFLVILDKQIASYFNISDDCFDLNRDPLNTVLVPCFILCTGRVKVKYSDLCKNAETAVISFCIFRRKFLN